MGPSLRGPTTDQLCLLLTRSGTPNCLTDIKYHTALEDRGPTPLGGRRRREPNGRGLLEQAMHLWYAKRHMLGMCM